MPISFHRKEALDIKFTTWLNQQPGIIRWPAPIVDGQTNRIVHNLRVAGVEDSALFPKSNVIVNPSFTADIDWTKGDAAITISGGKATWSGAQAGDADLTATVAPLTSGDRYGRNIVLSGVSAGTLTPLFGTQAGAAMDASGTYPIDEQVANGTAFVLRGDSSFVGSCELVQIPPTNPLNATINSATVAQLFGRGGLRYANLYDGNNDFDNISSTALNSAWTGINYTVGLFFLIPTSTIWEDGTRDGFIRIASDDNNSVILEKSSAANFLTWWLRQGGGNVHQLTKAYSSIGPTSMFITVDSDNNIVTGYLNGQSIGNTTTEIGTWVGALSGFTVLGAGTSGPALPMNGLISDAIINPTRTMSAIEIAEYHRRWEGG